MSLQQEQESNKFTRPASSSEIKNTFGFDLKNVFIFNEKGKRIKS